MKERLVTKAKDIDAPIKKKSLFSSGNKQKKTKTKKRIEKRQKTDSSALYCCSS